jgi:hypothetical protein
MYCTSGGLKASGRSCAACGTRTDLPGDVPVVIAVGNWEYEVRYAALLQFPEVRDRLARVPARGRAMTGKEWLGLYDAAFKPQTGVSMKSVAAVAAPIYARLGIKTGKHRTEVLPEPSGRVMVGVLCALARHRLPLVEVHQGESGCVFEAKLPSDLWAFEGQVVVTVERLGATTKVEAATNIPGQLFDWGKSTRCLEKLFGDLRGRAA